MHAVAIVFTLLFGGIFTGTVGAAWAAWLCRPRKQAWAATVLVDVVLLSGLGLLWLVDPILAIHSDTPLQLHRWLGPLLLGSWTILGLVVRWRLYLLARLYGRVAWAVGLTHASMLLLMVLQWSGGFESPNSLTADFDVVDWSRAEADSEGAHLEWLTISPDGRSVVWYGPSGQPSRLATLPATGEERLAVRRGAANRWDLWAVVPGGPDSEPRSARLVWPGFSCLPANPYRSALWLRNQGWYKLGRDAGILGYAPDRAKWSMASRRDGEHYSVVVANHRTGRKFGLSVNAPLLEMIANDVWLARNEAVVLLGWYVIHVDFEALEVAHVGRARDLLGFVADPERCPTTTPDSLSCR